MPFSSMTNQNTGEYENFMPIADNNKGFKNLNEKLRNQNSSMSKIIYYMQAGVNAPGSTLAGLSLPSQAKKSYNITVNFKAPF